MTIYSIPPFLTLCCFLGLAALTIRRGIKTKVHFLFTVICIIGCFLYIDILFAFNLDSEKTALKISRVDHAFIVFLMPVYLHFFHEYLGIRQRKWLLRLAYALAAAMMCLTQTDFYFKGMYTFPFGLYAKGGVLYPLFGLAAPAVTIYTLVLIYRAIRQEHKSVRKNSLKYVMAGFGSMGVLNALNVLPAFGYALYPPGNFSFIPLMVFYFGLFKHDLLDMGVVIKTGFVYSILTGLITGFYGLLVIATNKVFSNLQPTQSVGFTIVFFILVVIVFGPLKTKTQALIDRRFYREKIDYQKALRNASRMITSVRDLQEIAHRLNETITTSMQVDHCAIFIKFPSEKAYRCTLHSPAGMAANFGEALEPDHPIIQTLFTEQRALLRQHRIGASANPDHSDVYAEMERINTAVILPLMNEDRLMGGIAIGEKRSGQLFTREDLDLLETLANQTALAIENAFFYEQIKKLNENLEKKVAARTRELAETLKEKERTQELLVRSESLAAIGQLVAGTAHELNNPLASASSIMQSTIEDIMLWDGQAPLDEDLIEDLHFAVKELARAKAIVSSLLGLSRQTQTFEERVDINVVVDDALKVLATRYKNKAIGFDLRLSPDLPKIQGNFANLGQAIINIIQNAIDAVENTGGTITLTTSHEKEKNRVVFSCEDDGPGIQKEMQQDIFKPFFTTKSVGKGTGLGLYICHQIIDKHDGSLNIDAGTAQGTCFIIKLPVIRPASSVD